MSIGVAIILAVGFVLGAAIIGFGLAICGCAKYAILDEQGKAAMAWLREDSIDWAKSFAKATTEVFEDLE